MTESKKVCEFSFDEICESRDFNHDEMFVLKTSYDKAIRTLKKVGKELNQLNSIGPASLILGCSKIELDINNTLADLGEE